ncbi:hypothetical protein MATL_G00008900 [Megalops atlanticus]|uniref:LITAF domain-containing protein n=1 Tax=Megalops atlanticus TaxID=7932 RepID=A0A9D3QHT5_MEGAT|nr:hypothetical protein MATL_G00008900 [Megalops atlanticus]
MDIPASDIDATQSPPSTPTEEPASPPPSYMESVFTSITASDTSPVNDDQVSHQDQEHTESTETEVQQIGSMSPLPVEVHQQCSEDTLVQAEAPSQAQVQTNNQYPVLQTPSTDSQPSVVYQEQSHQNLKDHPVHFQYMPAASPYPAMMYQQQSQQVYTVQPAPAGQPVVVVQQEVLGPLGDTPAITRCTNCNQRVTTKVLYKAGLLAWLLCILFIVLGLVCGCCLIPFVVNGFMDAHHYCPACNTKLYVHTRT